MLNKIGTHYIIILIFLLSILYWPSVFSAHELASTEIRMTLSILLILVLFLFLQNLSFRIYILFFFLILSFTFQIIFNADIYSFISFYLILFILILLINYFTNNEYRETLIIKYWTFVASYVVISAIVYFIILNNFITLTRELAPSGTHSVIIMSGWNLDYFNWQETLLHPFRIATDYFNIFGKSSLISRPILGEVPRVSSYFNEPGDFGIFCIVNLIIIKSLNKDHLFSLKNNNKIITLLTIFAGFLTLSVTYFLLLFVLFILEHFNRNQILFIITFSISLIILIYNLDHIVEYFVKSSLSDRLQRIKCGIQFTQNANIQQLLFGYGINKECIIFSEANDKYTTLGFSSGYFKILVHYGLLNLILVLSILWSLLRKHITSLLLFLIFFLVITWHSQYIFIFALLVLHSISNKNIKYKQSQNNRHITQNI